MTGSATPSEITQQPSVDEVFSPELERAVCEIVLGDRRHGLSAD